MRGGTALFLEKLKHEMISAGGLGVAALVRLAAARGRGEWLSGPGWIDAAAQRGSLFDRQTGGADVTQHDRSVPQLHTTGGTHFAFDLARHHYILRADRSVDAA